LHTHVLDLRIHTSPPHPVLRSFPTRRSSDLNYFSVDLTSAYSQKLKSYVRDYIFVNTQREDIPAIILLKDQMETSSPEFKKYWQDRKSTRLNSSHVKISYAVFCLKKNISNTS